MMVLDTSDFRTLAEWDWVQLPTGEVLHAIAWLPGVDAHGVTECGRAGVLRIPGAVSRMYANRCLRCCDRTGIAQGVGSPRNDPHSGHYVVYRRLARIARGTL